MSRQEAVFDPDPLAAVLLDRRAPASAQEAACVHFHAVCLARSPMLGERATALAAGHALAPADAARCVLDRARTASLVRALDARIAAARAASGGEIRVLYAGCGPFAPLALLLARRWRGHAVRFDLVDVHEQSIENAARLFALADASDTLGDLHCADAAGLRLGEGRRPRILVAEIMQRALTREPQVAVVANLLPQCAPDAALVPERITVDAILGRPAPSASASRRPLGRLLDLSATTLPAMAAAIRAGAGALPETVLRAPHDLGEASGLLLSTRIDVGPGEVLADEDSGLTTPLLVAEIGRVAGGETLGFTYRFGREPGFVVRRVVAIGAQ